MESSVGTLSLFHLIEGIGAQCTSVLLGRNARREDVLVLLERLRATVGTRFIGYLQNVDASGAYQMYADGGMPIGDAGVGADEAKYHLVDQDRESPVEADKCISVGQATFLTGVCCAALGRVYDMRRALRIDRIFIPDFSHGNVDQMVKSGADDKTAIAVANVQYIEGVTRGVADVYTMLNRGRQSVALIYYSGHYFTIYSTTRGHALIRDPLETTGPAVTIFLRLLRASPSYADSNYTFEIGHGTQGSDELHANNVCGYIAAHDAAWVAMRHVPPPEFTQETYETLSAVLGVAVAGAQ